MRHQSTEGPQIVRQCRSCPWRVDCVPDRDIPNGYYRWLRDQPWIKDWPALDKYIQAQEWGDDEDDDQPNQ